MVMELMTALERSKLMGFLGFLIFIFHSPDTRKPASQAGFRALSAIAVQQCGGS
jgi:hypothetical protein